VNETPSAHAAHIDDEMQFRPAAAESRLKQKIIKCNVNL